MAASALKDKRLVPGLLKVAGHHRKDQDYDCRPKWMAVAALARKTGQDFKQDKQAWAKWWQEQGHAAIDEELLKAWEPPPTPAKQK